MAAYRAKSPKDCTREQLERIVAALQAHMYLLTDDHDTETWNPDKEVDGADLVESIAICLECAGLTPDIGDSLQPAQSHAVDVLIAKHDRS